jgi:hypothetical protein
MAPKELDADSHCLLREDRSIFLVYHLSEDFVGEAVVEHPVELDDLDDDPLFFGFLGIVVFVFVDERIEDLEVPGASIHVVKVFRHFLFQFLLFVHQLIIHVASYFHT